MDATIWYPIFSNIILPINSVFNPLLYDAHIASFFLRPVQSTFRTITTMSIRSSREVSESVDVKPTNSKPVGEEIEMKEFENVRGCNGEQELRENCT